MFCLLHAANLSVFPLTDSQHFRIIPVLAAAVYYRAAMSRPFAVE